MAPFGRLHDEEVVVTRAAQGIGLDTARAVAGGRGNVALADLEDAVALTAAAQLSDEGLRAEAQVLARQLIARHGRIEASSTTPASTSSTHPSRCLGAKVTAAST